MKKVLLIIGTIILAFIIFNAFTSDPTKVETTKAPLVPKALWETRVDELHDHSVVLDNSVTIVTYTYKNVGNKTDYASCHLVALDAEGNKKGERYDFDNIQVSPGAEHTDVANIHINGGLSGYVTAVEVTCT